MPDQNKKLSTIKELYGFYKKNLLKENKKKFLILSSAMGVCSIFCGVFIPLTAKWSINSLNLAIGKGVLGVVLPLSIAIEQTIRGVERFINNYIGTSWESFTFSTERPLALKKTRQVANIPEAAKKKQSSELAQIANQNAQYATRLLLDTAILTFYVPYLLSSIALIGFLSPAIGAVSLGTCVFNGFLTYKNSKQNKEFNEDFRQTNNKYTSRQIDVVDHYHRVKILGRESQEREDLTKLSQEAQAILFKKNRKFLFNKAIQQFLASFSNIVISIWAAIEGIRSGDIGTSMAIISASNGLTYQVGNIADTYGHMRETFDSYRNTEKDLEYDKSHELNYGNTVPEKTEGKIEFRDTGYTYPGQEKKVLTEINLSLGAGITVITGPSGSGKSTLLKLLQHTREGEGSILLDGVPLTELPYGYLEQQIAVVNQRPDFFAHRSLQENLKSVSPSADRHSIRKALKKAALADEISPQEYESKKMYELSGGQQQRENIAESFLQDKPIIIYDEPTANLDERNKRRIWHNIQRISRYKTVVIVTHDVREIESADRIIYLKDGMVVQDGTPDDLKQQNGPVRDLLESFRRPFRLSERAIKEEKKRKLQGIMKSHKKRLVSKRMKKMLEERNNSRE